MGYIKDRKYASCFTVVNLEIDTLIIFNDIRNINLYTK